MDFTCSLSILDWIFFRAMRARAAGCCRWGGDDDSHQPSGIPHQVQQIRVGDAVVNEAPFPAVQQDFRLAQRHQMLGDVRLALAQQRFQMAHASFPFANPQQDRQAGGSGDGLQGLGDGLCILNRDTLQRVR